jgi:hypothetical protein
LDDGSTNVLSSDLQDKSDKGYSIIAATDGSVTLSTPSDREATKTMKAASAVVFMAVKCEEFRDWLSCSSVDDRIVGFKSLPVPLQMGHSITTSYVTELIALLLYLRIAARVLKHCHVASDSEASLKGLLRLISPEILNVVVATAREVRGYAASSLWQQVVRLLERLGDFGMLDPSAQPPAERSLRDILNEFPQKNVKGKLCHKLCDYHIGGSSLSFVSSHQNVKEKPPVPCLAALN